jgi:hypothetical protein
LETIHGSLYHRSCDYNYEELFNELEEICRVINEPMDDLFQRVMQIFCRFPERGKPSDQEILD